MKLVAYFSATGTTKTAAEKVAAEMGADIFEIAPEVAYCLSMMPVPLSILDYFKNPSRGCPLIDYCKYSKVPNVNETQCIHSPWEQCMKRKLCPLALYFTAFALDEKEFVIEDRIQ